MHVPDHLENMKSYLRLIEGLNPEVTIEETKVEQLMEESVKSPLVADLEDLVFKMRAFMETAGGDYANGVEDGFQRAADMLETLLVRHTTTGRQNLG